MIEAAYVIAQIEAGRRDAADSIACLPRQAE
jgi:hypothetical protein